MKQIIRIIHIKFKNIKLMTILVLVFSNLFLVLQIRKIPKMSENFAKWKIAKCKTSQVQWAKVTDLCQISPSTRPGEPGSPSGKSFRKNFDFDEFHEISESELYFSFHGSIRFFPRFELEKVSKYCRAWYIGRLGLLFRSGTWE